MGYSLWVHKQLNMTDHSTEAGIRPTTLCLSNYKETKSSPPVVSLKLLSLYFFFILNECFYFSYNLKNVNIL